MPPSTLPYLLGLRLREDLGPLPEGYPFSLPFLKDFELELRSPVTFFVGENGTGKSTLIEAIAVLCRLPASGGGRNELPDGEGEPPGQDGQLAAALRAAFRRRPTDGYFFRAEFHASFASLLDRRAQDPDFRGNPYSRYGGRSLHTRSHGEAFLTVMKNRIGAGLYLFDEPESALSPQRQLSLLVHMHRLAEGGESQFLIATHSPIMLTYPGADIVSFDEGPLRHVTLEETSHYQITRDILQSPVSYWKHLGAPEEPPPGG